MSVKFHEAFCLDSARRRYHFGEHFLGDSLRDLWTVSTPGGSSGVIDAQDGGIIRLTTGATSANTGTLSWNNVRSLHVDKKVTIEIRMKLAQTNAMFFYMGLRFDFSNMIVFWYETALGHTKWYSTTRDGGAGALFESGITVDTDYHIFRIECFPSGEVHFYIDDVETANSPLTANIPDDAGDYLQPFISFRTQEDVAKSVDIDYVVIRQNR